MIPMTRPLLDDAKFEVDEFLHFESITLYKFLNFIFS